MKPPFQSLLTAQELRLLAGILFLVVLGWVVKSYREPPLVAPFSTLESEHEGMSVRE
jgi:hypothetical protein